MHTLVLFALVDGLVAFVYVTLFVRLFHQPHHVSLLQTSVHQLKNKIPCTMKYEANLRH
jgi:hypothetical protein